MQVVLSTPKCTVIDDFLTAAEFKLVRTAVANAEHRMVNVAVPGNAWSLVEGAPFVTDALYNDSEFDRRNPFATALAVFARRIEEHFHLFADVIDPGAERSPRFSLSSYIYPQGAGLNWHQDGGYLGAYTYFCHASWHRRWGGDLLLSSTEPRERAGLGVDDTAPPPDLGLGQFITPLPNRLSIIRGGTSHRIIPVGIVAGEHARRSLSGFFTRPQPSATSSGG